MGVRAPVRVGKSHRHKGDFEDLGQKKGSLRGGVKVQGVT